MARGHRGLGNLNDLRAFFEFQIYPLFFEVEISELMLVHELDDFTNFLKIHSSYWLVVMRHVRKLP